MAHSSSFRPRAYSETYINLMQLDRQLKERRTASMSSLDTKTLASLFLLPENITVEAGYPPTKRLTIQISCTLPSASCPQCGATSDRIHGRYVRTVADVPYGGRLVRLALTVRKFVCHTPDCPRQIFDLSASRFGAVICSYDQSPP